MLGNCKEISHYISNTEIFINYSLLRHFVRSWLRTWLTRHRQTSWHRELFATHWESLEQGSPNWMSSSHSVKSSLGCLLKGHRHTPDLQTVPSPKQLFVRRHQSLISGGKRSISLKLKDGIGLETKRMTNVRIDLIHQQLQLAIYWKIGKLFAGLLRGSYNFSIYYF